MIMKSLFGEFVKIIIASFFAFFTAYFVLSKQLDDATRKVRAQLTHQSQIEAIKIDRERITRIARIEELAEMARWLSKRLVEDSALAADSIDLIYAKRVDSLRRAIFKRTGGGMSPSISIDKMMEDKIRAENEIAKRRWTALRRRPIEDISVELQSLKHLNLTDTLSIPNPIF